VEKLNPKCLNCGGACCKGIVLEPTPESWAWFSLHGEPEGKKVYISCPCKNLENGKCLIYETRPEACILYEVGSEACRNAVKRTGREFDEL
jgi:Fe-S-cluster containining protein